MSFKEEFKTLLEELVLPEIDTIKSQIDSVRDSIAGNTDSLKSDMNKFYSSRHARMDILIESIQDLSKQVRALTSSIKY